MNTKQKIEALIESDLSVYAIAKYSGVSQTSVNNIKRGKYDLDKISLGNAEKLADYFDRRANKIELEGTNKVVREVLRSEFREIMESQLDLWNEERVDDERFTFWVLNDLFRDVLSNNVKIVELAKHINNVQEPTESDINFYE